MDGGRGEKEGDYITKLGIKNGNTKEKTEPKQIEWEKQTG